MCILNNVTSNTLEQLREGIYAHRNYDIVFSEFIAKYYYCLIAGIIRNVTHAFLLIVFFTIVEKNCTMILCSGAIKVIIFGELMPHIILKCILKFIHLRVYE